MNRTRLTHLQTLATPAMLGGICLEPCEREDDWFEMEGGTAAWERFQGQQPELTCVASWTFERSKSKGGDAQASRVRTA